MKKLLLVGLVMVLGTSAFAQMTVIPKAGITYSNVNVTDDMLELEGANDPNSKIGFMVGAALEIGLNEKFAVQPELLFIQKGFEFEGSDGSESYTDSYKINYLEIPVLFKAKFGKFYANAGPSFAFGLGGKNEWEYSYQGVSEDGEEDIKFGDDPGNTDDIYFDNSFDLGIQLGVGYQVGPVVVDLRYGMGMSDINDKPDGFSGDWSFKNRSWQLTVGFPIGLGD